MSEIEFAVAGASDMREILLLQELVFGLEYGRNPEDPIDADAVYFLARCPGFGIMAAFRLLKPSCRPFDFEDALNVDDLITVGGAAAAIGRLCLHPAYRSLRTSVRTNYGLLSLCRDFALSNRITDLFLITYPRLVKFYGRAGFSVRGVPFVHSMWGSVYLMHVRVANLLTSSRNV